jgi:hypothetical protein
VNLDHLTFIGAGSEWFWSMAQFVIVAITLVGIYRQVRLAASASAIQQMDAITREWRSEASTRQGVEILGALQDGVSLSDIPYGAASSIGDFWEGIGYLVRHGHIDFRLFYDHLGPSSVWWWTLLRPWTLRVRTEASMPNALKDFEWIAGRVADQQRREGDMTVYDEAHIRNTFERRLENDRDRVRLAEQLRAVPAGGPTAAPRRRAGKSSPAG